MANLLDRPNHQSSALQVVPVAVPFALIRYVVEAYALADDTVDAVPVRTAERLVAMVAVAVVAKCPELSCESGQTAMALCAYSYLG